MKLLFNEDIFNFKQYKYDIIIITYRSTYLYDQYFYFYFIVILALSDGSYCCVSREYYALNELYRYRSQILNYYGTYIDNE